MRNEKFMRTELLLGKQAMDRLRACRVAVFGIGGVGGHAAEAVARSGVGHIVLIDNDTVSETNINRQIIADTSTVGRMKTEVMKERLLLINPDLDVTCHGMFFSEDTKDEIDFSSLDYIIDAIDSVSSKITLILEAKKASVPIISSMGTGNKMDPTRLEVADIYKTSVCPLARVMRRELKKREVEGLEVVYSREPAIKPDEKEMKELIQSEGVGKRQIPGSNAFVPAAAGLIMASRVIRNLTEGENG